jgi:hypothetical protein
VSEKITMYSKRSMKVNNAIQSSSRLKLHALSSKHPH